MSEPFLEEQLRRIRQMSESISEVRSRQDELSKLIERDREQLHQNPLDEVRDFRAGTHTEEPRGHADERPARRRQPAVRRRR